MTRALSLATNRFRLFILLLYIVLGVVYSFATPILEKPDEESHAWFIQYLTSGAGLPIQVPGTPDAPLHREGSQPPLYYALSSLVWRLFDTSNLDLELQPNASPSFSPYGVGNKNLLLITPEKRAFNYRGATLAILVLRLLGLLPGCLTIWMTFGIAYRLTQNQNVALLSSGLVAFNPMFVNVTSALGNDGLVIALSTIALYLICDLALVGITPRRLVMTGIVTALACLTKVSGMVLLPVVAVAVCGRAMLEHMSEGQPRSQRMLKLIWQGAALAAIWIVVSGWWYVRNWFLYNDFTGTTVMAQMMTPRDYSLGQALSEFGGFAMSFIAMFAHFAVPADNIVYVVFDAIVLLAVIGLLLAWVRIIQSRSQPSQESKLNDHTLIRLRLLVVICLLLHMALMLLSILRWTMMTPASQGRLLFPALAGISTFMAIGLLQFEASVVHGRTSLARAFLPAILIPFFFLSAIAPWRYIIPAYAPPILTHAPDNVTPATQHLGALADLLAYRMTPRDIHPGDKVLVTSVFRVRSVPRSNYLLVVKLYGRDNAELARFDTFTGSGLYPSSQWHVGDLWQDEEELMVPSTAATPAILRVQFDLYDRGSGNLIKSTDAQGHAGSPLFDGSTLVPPVQTSFPEPLTLASIGDIGVITGYTHTLLMAGRPMTVTLDWRSLKPADKDYTVFVHLLDASGRLIAQHDGQPDAGNYDASRWSSGVYFQDSHVLSLPVALAPGQYSLAVGMYDPTNGARLIVLDRDRIELPDRTFILAHIEVR